MRPGHVITLTAVLALVVAAVLVAFVSPPLSGGHLIGAPLLIVLAGGILVRYRITLERNRP